MSSFQQVNSNPSEPHLRFERKVTTLPLWVRSDRAVQGRAKSRFWACIMR